jgi:electron transfer flavoprotein-quinone oxidoreductase
MPPAAPHSPGSGAFANGAAAAANGATGAGVPGAPTPGSFDAVVVGAGPAGTSAALALAQKGAKVLLLERGEYPGAKNMFGGMTAYCPAPEQLVPGFWERAPWERAVTKRILSVVGGASSTSLVFQAESGSDQPSVDAGSTSDRGLTGFTLFRPQFDRWYAEQAVAKGVTLLTGCRAEGLVIRDGAVRGVRVTGVDDIVEAPLVIACDGTLSFLAQEACLHKGFGPEQVALGVRALYALTEEEVNDRFGLNGREGATHEFLGCTQGVRGGGFIYTQTETLSVGVVVHLDSLKARGVPPYELLERFVASSPVAHVLRGARLVEYSAHLLPEAGMRMVPRLSTAGLLVAGDAAGFCYTNGLTQEGMNLAMTSGMIAGQVGAEALAAGDVSASRLSQYGKELKRSFVLRDLTRWGRAIDFMHHDRLFTVYPRVVSALMEDVYRSEGHPKEKILRLGRRAAKDALPVRRLIADMFEAGRAFLW